MFFLFRSRLSITGLVLGILLLLPLSNLFGFPAHGLFAGLDLLYVLGRTVVVDVLGTLHRFLGHVGFFAELGGRRVIMLVMRLGRLSLLRIDSFVYFFIYCVLFPDTVMWRYRGRGALF